MSGRIEAFNSQKEDTGNKYSRNESFSVKEAGVDIEQDPKKALMPNLTNLADVYTSNLQNDQILKYNSETGEWNNANDNKGCEINDEEASATTTYSSSKIEELIAAIPTGGGSITRVTSSPMSSSTVTTSVTVEKED